MRNRQRVGMTSRSRAKEALRRLTPLLVAVRQVGVGQQVVQGLVVLGVRELLRVDAKDLADVNVVAFRVDLRVVRPKRLVADTVDLLDPCAGATFKVRT